VSTTSWPLAKRRDGGQATQYVQQVSFIVKDMDGLREFYHRLQDEGLRIDRTVTHGISCSIYLFDPEDNRVELYYKTGFNVRRPWEGTSTLTSLTRSCWLFPSPLRPLWDRPGEAPSNRLQTHCLW